jgi:hypothetical protein
VRTKASDIDATQRMNSLPDHDATGHGKKFEEASENESDEQDV